MEQTNKKSRDVHWSKRNSMLQKNDGKISLSKVSVVKSKNLKIGKDVIHEAAEMLQLSGIYDKKILYVSDPVVDEIYGYAVKEQLRNIGDLKEEYVDYNTIAYAMSIAERVIATDVDCIVGMGGGRVLDVCKYASYISKIPMLSIPTTAANDGMVSPIAVLKRQDNKPKSLGCVMPAMILIDINVIQRGPKQLIQAGIGDTISNYMALKDWEIAVKCERDEMNGYAYLMSKNALDVLLKTQYESICADFVEVLVNSLVISGIAMDFAGSSRPVSGSEHLFSHALDYYSPVKNLHGIQTALGTVAVLKMMGESYDEVLSYLRKFEIDINPNRLGIKEDIFIECMQKSILMRNNRYTYLNEADLGTKTLRRVYKELEEEL